MGDDAQAGTRLALLCAALLAITAMLTLWGYVLLPGALFPLDGVSRGVLRAPEFWMAVVAAVLALGWLVGPLVRSARVGLAIFVAGVFAAAVADSAVWLAQALQQATTLGMPHSIWIQSAVWSLLLTFAYVFVFTRLLHVPGAEGMGLRISVHILYALGLALQALPVLRLLPLGGAPVFSGRLIAGVWLLGRNTVVLVVTIGSLLLACEGLRRLTGVASRKVV